MLYREEAGYAVVFEPSIVSWDFVITDGFIVLNIDVDDSFSVSLLETSDISSPEPSSVVARMELASFFSVTGETEDFSVGTVNKLSCSSEGTMVGFSVLNKEDDVLAEVLLSWDISELDSSGCTVEMTVALSVEKEGDAETVDTAMASAFFGSIVLNKEDDVVVTVSCVDTSDV